MIVVIENDKIVHEEHCPRTLLADKANVVSVDREWLHAVAGDPTMSLHDCIARADETRLPRV